MRKASIVGLVAAFGFLGIYAGNLFPWALQYNRTDSEPKGFYLAHRHVSEVTRGELVCFKYRPPDWALGRYLPPGAQICKQVLGLPGDTVRQSGMHLSLEHDGSTTDLGEMLTADSKGRSVHPLPWGVTAIPPGKYYLGSTRIMTSFDSRYLGLIDKSDVIEQIYPLYTF